MDRPAAIEELQDGLVRVLAPNPSPMTYWGTNSFVLGNDGPRVILDPGPDDRDHLAAIVEVSGPAGVDAILVTHAHKDHAAGARRLQELTGAPIYAFGDARSGRSQVMQKLAASGYIGGGEGVDLDFAPDRKLSHGQVLDTSAGRIVALHTPGHMGNHLCFEWRGVLFTGDLVMGWSSSLISPPDGDVAAYRMSCNQLLLREPTRMYPAHGPAIEDGAARIRDLLAHREVRETAIIAALTQSPQSIEAITRAVYSDIPERALPVAARNTFAHLIDLTSRNIAKPEPEISENGFFSLA